MIVAEAARNRCASRKIFRDKGTHYIALEALCVIDHVVGDADVLGHAARVINIIEGAAAARDLLGHALVSGQTALVPKLHGQADDVVPFRAQHGRDGGGIDSARHGYGDRLLIGHVLVRAITIAQPLIAKLLPSGIPATTPAIGPPPGAQARARYRYLPRCSACP